MGSSERMAAARCRIVAAWGLTGQTCRKIEEEVCMNLLWPVARVMQDTVAELPCLRIVRAAQIEWSGNPILVSGGVPN
jgi:hypothetical protein